MWSQPARIPQAHIQTKRGRDRDTSGEGRASEGERAPKIPRVGRKELATGCAAPHADEWETRESTTRPSEAGHRSPLLSLLPPYHRDYKQMLQATRRRPRCSLSLVTGVLRAGGKRGASREMAAKQQRDLSPSTTALSASVIGQRKTRPDWRRWLASVSWQPVIARANEPSARRTALWETSVAQLAREGPGEVGKAGRWVRVSRLLTCLHGSAVYPIERTGFLSSMANGGFLSSYTCEDRFLALKFLAHFPTDSVIWRLLYHSRFLYSVSLISTHFKGSGRSRTRLREVKPTKESQVQNIVQMRSN